LLFDFFRKLFSLSANKNPRHSERSEESLFTRRV